jgi:endonuclease/exonuclease/phosphatase (EEP) superfamily protein YafD
MRGAARSATRYLASRLVLLGWVCAAATLLAYFGPLWWMLDLFVHFRPQYALCLVASAAAAALTGRRIVMAVMLAAALVNALEVAPAFRGSMQRDKSAAAMRVVVFNLGLDNTRFDAVARFLAESRADAVVLLEVGSRWRQPLAALQAVYAHQLVHPREDPFGLALLSAHPCMPCEVIEEDGRVPAILGRLALQGRQVWVAAVHAVPPVSAEWSRARDDHLEHIARHVARLDGPRLMAGDFNTTPWAPSFRVLTGPTGLRDGGLALASWPTFLPFPVVPIDHVLVSRELAVLAQWRGPDLGSDHYPIGVELRAVR